MKNHDIKQQSANQHIGEADPTALQRGVGGSPQKVAVPSNTATCNYRNDGNIKFLRWGIDSLYLSYRGNLHPEINQQLIQLKKLAQSDNPQERAKAQIKVGQHLFAVKDKGSSMFSYVLEDNVFRIQLSRPDKAVPMAYVKISSEYLTHLLPDQAESRLNSILCELGVLESTANVSRVDMFVDFVSYQDMEAWGRDAWVTRSDSINAYSLDKRFTGWAIGLGGDIAMRLYDKLLEIEKSKKDYLIPLWTNAGWIEGEPIWRLEFEFKRELLTQKDLSKLTSVLDHLNGLWSYATTEWVKLKLPQDNDTNQSRWPVHPFWAALSSIDWETSGGELISRVNLTRAPSKEAAFGRVLSGITTWMAINGYSDYELAIHPFFEDLAHFINNQALNKGTSFESLVKEKVGLKAREFNTMDVNADIYENYVNEEVHAMREAYENASKGD